MTVSEFELSFILISLFIFLIKVMHVLVRKIDMPDVLGELILGFILGPTVFGIFYLGDNPKSSLSGILGIAPEQLETTSTVVSFISEFAVLLLLFKVGAEVNIKDLQKVGKKAINISLGGILVPFAFGFAFVLLMSQVIGVNVTGTNISLMEVATLVGLILTATSIGIALRIFLDMDIIRSRMSQGVIGAAVIDDILSVTLLGLSFTYLANSNGFELSEVGIIVAQILLFFVISFVLFKYVIPKLKTFTTRFKDRSIPVFVSIGFMLGMSVLAQVLSLTPIIGAFVAGIIIGNENDYLDIHSDFEPISTWIIPFFFLSIGLHINARTLMDPVILLLAALLTLFSIAAKVSGGAVGAKLSGYNRSESNVIGLSMAARGEVTLIFSAEAFIFGFISYQLYGVILLSVVIGILIIVPLLKLMISRNIDCIMGDLATDEECMGIVALATD